MATTPGPWDIQNKGNLYGSSARLEVVKGINQHSRKAFPTIAKLKGLSPEDYANARLMAAAPEMLAALGGFVQRVSALKSQLRRPVWLDACMKEAEAAIAKAKKEGGATWPKSSR